MQVTAVPAEFFPPDGFEVVVSGGTPPFTYTPLPSPPNPEGVTVTPDGDEASVSIPPTTPPGTGVAVRVTDSSTPPVTRQATSTTK